ncbi:NAD-dependent epimerase/dehydratase family protein [Candidatus Latescibacterota bacterium]
MKKVLVTGSNGFVGQAVCRQLAQKGYLVKAVIMKGTNNIYSSTNTISPIIINSIEPNTDWTDILDNIDTIVHLAARVHVMKENSFKSIEEYRRINTESTINLVKNAIKMKVRRIIFLSTVKVYGINSQNRPFIETDLTYPKDPYAQSKLEAEMKLFEIASHSALDVVVIRSPLVYGPGVKANFLRLMQFVNLGIPWPFGKLNNTRSYIYLENLADAIITCSNHSAAANQIFLVSDGHDMSTPELLRNLSISLGKISRMFNFNGSLFYKLCKLLRKTEQVNRLFGSLTVDTSKIRRELNWTPPYKVKEGLRETAEWFKKTYN